MKHYRKPATMVLTTLNIVNLCAASIVPLDRESMIHELMNVRYKFNEASKIKSFVLGGGNQIDIFAYADKTIFVKYKDGKSFEANLDDLIIHFSFNPAHNMRIANIIYRGISYWINENIAWASPDIWNQIFKILLCAQTIKNAHSISPAGMQFAKNQYLLKQNQKILQQNQQRMLQQQQQFTRNLLGL